MQTSKHIRIIGPSSHVTPDLISGGISWLEQQGFLVSVADQVYFQNGQSAGTVQDKIDALHAAFADPSVDIIMASCGGNGAIHLLDKIDYDLIRANPKPLIGFSDATILLNTIHARTGIVTYHGPTVKQIQKPLSDIQLGQMVKILNGEKSPIQWNDCQTINFGEASGRLIGGNMAVFQTLIGTKYMPNLDTPYILFIEDIADELSRYDRMLAHFRHAGLLHNASAILFGDISGNDTPSRLPFRKNIEEIINNAVRGLDIPIAMHCPFGHRGNLWTLPVGQECHLDIKNSDTINLVFN